jgi:hypothetical protein
MRSQILLSVILTSFIFLGLNDKSSLQKPLINDHYTYITINEIKMWISNNGDGSHDPNTDGNGLYWPGGVDCNQSSSV